jgi:hypothetical protein
MHTLEYELSGICNTFTSCYFYKDDNTYLLLHYLSYEIQFYASVIHLMNRIKLLNHIVVITICKNIVNTLQRCNLVLHE